PTTTPAKDEPKKEPAKEEKKEEAKNPFRGSILLLDQSMTTNSFSKGSQLSYSPLYEWWISPRFYYSPTDNLKFGARFDLFKEMSTHPAEPTKAPATPSGAPGLPASYADSAKFITATPKSRWNVGLTLRPPLSKDSRANGQYFAFGPNAGLTWGFDLAGPKA